MTRTPNSAIVSYMPTARFAKLIGSVRQLIAQYCRPISDWTPCISARLRLELTSTVGWHLGFEGYTSDASDWHIGMHPTQLDELIPPGL
jgi:hypothetical protein